MIRIRKADGTVMPVPAEGHFVELVNDVDQTVQMVVFQPQAGVIMQLMPGSQDARRYAEMFASQGVKFTSKMVTR